MSRRRAAPPTTQRRERRAQRAMSQGPNSLIGWRSSRGALTASVRATVALGNGRGRGDIASGIA